MAWVDAYNALVREHFAAPRHTPCHPPGPEVVFATAGRESDGVQYRLSAQVEGETLREVRFETYGCPHSIAAASMLTEQLRGSSLEAAAGWTWQQVSRLLEIPAEKRGRLLILEDALRSLIAAARTSHP
jgi:nitrogen fixation NifU-like protein